MKYKIPLVYIILSIYFASCQRISKKKFELQKKLMFSKLTSKSNIQERDCSLKRSSLVRRLLLKDFYPIYEKYNLKIPVRCPFNKERNMYNLFENFKREISSTIWKCEKCGKKFELEEYLNDHMMVKHAELIMKHQNKVCFNDYCDVFRCDLHEQYPNIKTNPKLCDSNHVRNLQRKCERILGSCLPDDMRHYVYDSIYSSLCLTLTCSQFYTPFEDISTFWVVLLSLGIPLLAIVTINVLCFWCEYMDNEEAESLEIMQRNIYDTGVVRNTNRAYYYESKANISKRR